MEKKIEDVNSVKVGRYVLIDEVPCKVTAITKSKPGKHGGAKAKIDAVGVFDNQKRSIIKPTSQKIEMPIVDKRAAQVLTFIGDNIQLMDMESYETFELPRPGDGDLNASLAEGKEVVFMQVGGMKKILQVRGE